ncbi:hypothetical protein BDV37DRAFT_103460 [Aspergillus pseudonomiae]|uniref:Transcription factor domain-containing protein n=1 Tax=Aspergillus pseudonomiae TaxID=1506151 RepID=A0A5N7DF81_9EURO|nr:uncharacterized protein BDV37DRAFT_103460 [Aspergillus pseudonomiae]KAE8404914.1 hypothetical protein BDV37DRAFT_103460 [Aspergillus pseudonomiae]
MKEKPFFWYCLTAVLTPNLTQRESLFTKVHNTIYQELLVDIAPNMDILLGLMTFMSWKIYCAKPFLNFYSHILTGVVCELGINKAPLNEQTILQGFNRAAGLKTDTAMSRTLEERRAVLGCFLITSSIASSLFKSDALRWTPHMEESLEILASTKECVGDELLVWLVRIQLVVDKSYHLRRDGENSHSSPLVTDLLQSQLDSIKRQIPSQLTKNNVISMYFSNAELAIHEVFIKAPIPTNCPDPQGLKSLHISLLATKSWLDVWLCVPPEHYLAVSFTILFQFCRALVNLFKLSTLDDPSWDKNAVQDSVNLLHYLDQLQINFKRSSDHLGQDAEANIFAKGVKMITAIKERWGPSLMQARQYLPATEVANPTLQNTLGNSDDFRLDGIDDVWMMELLGFL